MKGEIELHGRPTNRYAVITCKHAGCTAIRVGPRCPFPKSASVSERKAIEGVFVNAVNMGWKRDTTHWFCPMHGKFKLRIAQA